MTQAIEDYQQVLKQLKDIHYPDAPMLWPLDQTLWWPPAPLRLALLIALATIVLYFLVKLCARINTYIKNRAIRLALRSLNSISQQYQSQNQNKQPQKVTQQISVLLKRCALAKFGKELKLDNKTIHVPSLSGESWLQFLNKTGATTEFTSDYGKLMVVLPYLKDLRQENKPSEQDILKLIAISKQWIKKNL